MLKLYFVVMTLGALGCAARMGLSTWLAKYESSFPLGTWVVNILGCFILGGVLAFFHPSRGICLSPILRQGLIIGLLGGFTTFSSFTLQTLMMLYNKEWGLALGYNALSLGVGLFALWLGQRLVMLVLA